MDVQVDVERLLIHFDRLRVLPLLLQNVPDVVVGDGREQVVRLEGLDGLPQDIAIVLQRLRVPALLMVSVREVIGR